MENSGKEAISVMEFYEQALDRFHTQKDSVNAIAAEILLGTEPSVVSTHIAQIDFSLQQPPTTKEYLESLNSPSGRAKLLKGMAQ